MSPTLPRARATSRGIPLQTTVPTQSTSPSSTTLSPDTVTISILFAAYALSSILLTLINKLISVYLWNQKFEVKGPQDAETTTAPPQDDKILRNIAQNTILVMQNIVAMTTIVSASHLNRRRRKHEHAGVILGSDVSAATTDASTGAEVQAKPHEQKDFLSFFEVKPYKWRHFKMILPLCVTFVVMLYSSLKLFGTVSIATVVVFRNVGTLFIAFFDKNKKFSAIHWVAIVGIIAGALVYRAGAEQPEGVLFLSVGIKWLLLNQVVVTLNALLEKSITTNIKDQTPTGISLFLNVSSSVSFTVSTLIIYFTSDIAQRTGKSLWQLILVSMSVFPLYHVVLAAGSGVLAMGIGMSYFALNSTQSATSIKIVNNLARLVSVVLAAYCFGDSLSQLAFVGMLVCLGAGLVYSIG